MGTVPLNIEIADKGLSFYQAPVDLTSGCIGLTPRILTEFGSITFIQSGSAVSVAAYTDQPPPGFEPIGGELAIYDQPSGF